jgi:hypothetical protein
MPIHKLSNFLKASLLVDFERGQLRSFHETFLIEQISMGFAYCANLSVPFGALGAQARFVVYSERRTVLSQVDSVLDTTAYDKLSERFAHVRSIVEQAHSYPLLKPIADLQFLDHLPNFVFVLTKLLLKPSKQFVFFPFRKHQIVIGEIPLLLFKLALQLVPRTLHF